MTTENNSKNELKKKPKFNKKHLMIGGLVVALGVGSLAAYTAFKKDSKANIQYNAPDELKVKRYEAIERDTALDFSGGQMKITRNKVEDKSAESEDAWTVLVYLCGSDLESDKGVETKILDSMKGSNINADNIDKLNFVIETGGSSEWKSDYGTPENLTRLKLNASGEFEVVEKLENKSMGDPHTLAEFIEWGYTTYPAKNTMLILSDHGGPENNICYDQSMEKEDELTVQELEYALASSKDALEAPIDVVFSKTCGTGTVEVANALVPYADYLIGSPSSMAAYGFNFKKMLNSFLEEDVSPATVCDKLLSEYKKTSILRLYTDFTVVLYDLNKLDDFLVEYNNVNKQVFELSATDVGNIKKINKVAKWSSIYQFSFNMDIGLYLDRLNKKFNIDTSKCRELLENVIVRKVKGLSLPRKIAGMSTYHLDGYVSIQSLNNLRNKCVSPYYMMYIERTWHLLGKREFDNYKDYDWIASKYFYENNFNFLNYTVATYSNPLNYLQMKDLLKLNSEYDSDKFYDAWGDNIGKYTEEERNKTKAYKTYELKADDGTYKGKITENPEYINTVYNTVYAKLNDQTICLGENADAVYNEESGEFKSNFKGEWLMLSDGQLLTTYYTGIVNDYEQDENAENAAAGYAIPVQIDDKEATIYISKGKDGITAQYVSFDAYGAPVSGYREELTAGMKFTPIYDVWNEEDGTYETEYGEEYTFKGTDDFLYTLLGEEEYSYALVVEEASGYKMVSELHPFTVKGQEVELKTE